MASSSQATSELRRGSRKEVPTQAEEIQLSMQRHRHEYPKPTGDYFSDIKWDILGHQARTLVAGDDTNDHIKKVECGTPLERQSDKGFWDNIWWLVESEDAEDAEARATHESHNGTAIGSKQTRLNVPQRRNHASTIPINKVYRFEKWDSDTFKNPPGTVGRAVVLTKKQKPKELAAGPWCDDREAAIQGLLDQLEKGVLNMG